MNQNPTVVVLNSYIKGEPEDKEYVIFGSLKSTEWVLNLMYYRGRVLGTITLINPGRKTITKVKQWLASLGVTTTVQNTVAWVITERLNELEAVFESSDNPIRK